MAPDNACKVCKQPRCTCGKFGPVRIAILLLALVACGDNAAPTFDLPPSTAHSPESTVVRKGTYTLVPAPNNTVSWILSRGGEVMIPLRGLVRGNDLGWIRIQGAALIEPSMAVIDQVDNESLQLATSPAGNLAPLEGPSDISFGGVVTHTLVEPLFIGGEAEFVWLKIGAASDSPVQLYSIAWGTP